jgi:hypothetical protein
MKLGSAQSEQEQHLAEIMLPYFGGVALGTLNTVLDDEHHHVNDLRIAVKGLLKEAATEPGRVGEIIQDKVRPATDKVARRFQTLAATHGLKVIGSVAATACIALYSLTQSGIVASLGVVVAGGGGLQCLNQIADYIKAKSEARELPLYLLWRISQEPRT